MKTLSYDRPGHNISTIHDTLVSDYPELKGTWNGADNVYENPLVFVEYNDTTISIKIPDEIETSYVDSVVSAS